MAIALWWIGEAPADSGLLDEVGWHVEREFGQRVMQWTSDARPGATFDAARAQHASTAIVRWLASARPRAADRVLGVTDVDLFIPVLTFVFGEAQLDGVAAVVSTNRLADGVDAATARRRLVKESIHELGHTFGLVHCPDATCVMARSNTLRSVDAKRTELCAPCRVRYQVSQQDGLHV